MSIDSELRSAERENLNGGEFVPELWARRLRVGIRLQSHSVTKELAFRHYDFDRFRTIVKLVPEVKEYVIEKKDIKFLSKVAHCCLVSLKVYSEGWSWLREAKDYWDELLWLKDLWEKFIKVHGVCPRNVSSFSSINRAIAKNKGARYTFYHTPFTPEWFEFIREFRES